MWPRIPLTPGLTNLLAMASLLAAFSSGLDYIALPEPSPALTYVEQAMPLDLWGLTLIIGVTCAVVGQMVRFWPGVIAAHMTLAGCYAAFGVGALAAIALDFHGFGWRTGISWILLQGVVHLVLASAAWREWDRQRIGIRP